MVSDYLDQLNESQREAVLYNDGPSLVVAGAGAGKTRVLTYKIAHLLQNGYQPHTILALTFTNKAAREMKLRIASVTSEYVTRYLWMGTFHSIFCRILRREAMHIGYTSNFTIYDAADSKNLIKTIIKEMLLDDKTYRPGLIQSRISNAKNALITCDAYDRNKNLLQHDRYANIPLTNDIYRRYQTRCFQAGAMDFDEILLQTNILFRDFPDVLAKYREQFQYVLVDEYQDTNFAQHLIVARLSELHRRVFVVGDDAQSIYSFRGANIDNMLRFKDFYPEYKIFKLERNYRSTQNLVNAANSLIAKNTNQIQKTVYSEKEKGSRIIVTSSYSDYEEGYLVSAKILDKIRNKGCAYADFAILYRTNAQSRIFEEVMRKRLIKYKIYGAQSFYQRKEIKDVIAYLRVVVNPKDEESVKRIINYPTRGIGDTTIDKLMQAAVANNTSLWSVIGDPLAYSVAINKGTISRLQDFQSLIADFQEKNKAMDAAEIVEYVIKKSGISALLSQDISVEGVSRLENLQELLHAPNEFVSSRKEEGSEFISLTDFLMEVSLMTDQDNDKEENTDKVTLMTVHAAKGLEFKHVFVVGMEDDLFPSLHAMENRRELEEERRLFYVAITRAMEHCTITFSKTRFRNGKSNVAQPSMFLNDIEEKYLDFEDEVMLPSQKRNFFDDSTVQNDPWDADNAYRSSYRKPTYQPSSPRYASQTKPVQMTPRSFEKAPAEQSEKVQSLLGFKVGDRVVHSRFGEGVITMLEGKGNDAQAKVAFDIGEEKKLLLKFARLNKLSK